MHKYTLVCLFNPVAPDLWFFLVDKTVTDISNDKYSFDSYHVYTAKQLTIEADS